MAEGGDGAPDDWFMFAPLSWTGTFRGRTGKLLVDAGEDPKKQFQTDLASVPRPLTWLIPSYGRYTKAAIVHDYYCQFFAREEVVPIPAQGAPEDPAPDLDDGAIELKDRSDADELFRLVMTELGVPWLSRWLMWTAVSWATLLTSLRTGRDSKGNLRWIGRAILAVALGAGIVALVLGCPGAFLDLSFGSSWLRWSLLILIGWTYLALSVLIAGYVAQGRWDRLLVYLAALVFTVVAVPLLVPAAIAAFFLVLYLVAEDLPELNSFRDWIASLAAPPAPPTTPHEMRLAAVRES